jgi:hypothetical protein
MTARSSPSPPPGPAHLLAPADASPPLVVEVPASLVGPLWRLVREHLHRRRRNGGVVRPDEQALADALRASYLRQLQVASGHPLPGFSDTASTSDHRARMGPALVRTDQLADALGVTDRHARRLARAAGLQQARRGWWRADDVARLVESRRSPS